MKLTKTQAIEEHRKMWNWIADETEKQKICVYEEDYFHDIYPNTSVRNNCFLCEYAAYNFPVCRKCPLDFCTEYCTNAGSAFRFWISSLQACDWKSAAKYAREIANLKEKM